MKVFSVIKRFSNTETITYTFRPFSNLINHFYVKKFEHNTARHSESILDSIPTNISDI